MKLVLVYDEEVYYMTYAERALCYEYESVEALTRLINDKIENNKVKNSNYYQFNSFTLGCNTDPSGKRLPYEPQIEMSDILDERTKKPRFNVYTLEDWWGQSPFKIG